MKSLRLMSHPPRIRTEISYRFAQEPAHKIAVKQFAYVRFGSKADSCSATRHVRFTPDSDNKCDIWNVRLGRSHALQRSMLGLGQPLTLAETLRNLIIAARWP